MTTSVAAPLRRAARRRPVPRHALLLVPGGLALLAGLDAALQLIGLPRPVTAPRLGDVHGFLMVLGFLGTLIALERAVALGRPAGLAAPGLLGAGGLMLLTPWRGVGQVALVGGAAALVALYVPLWRRQRDEAVLVQALGAVLALGAAILWWGGVAVPALLPWLAGFVVLTIAGERVELARLTMGEAATQIVGLSVAVAAGALAGLLWPSVGQPLLGLTVLVLTGWLARHDVARRTVHAVGLPRFSAAGMLAGYAWLAVAGAIWLLAAPVTDGAAYDASVHAVFLGFTMSMVMVHAPVILPAVVRRPLPYHPGLWLPLGLLHLSLALRLWLGDALGSSTAWQAGGALNVASLLLFVVVAAACVVLGRR